GIAPEMQKSIFKKHLKTSREKGIGLGLYIVKAVIDAHPGGKIWFDSSEKGTTFYVYLRAAGK
ncbi:sensor histidine kinase, partial [Patescibacteria group bacterium]|nr:sensor histidine kinase [Patescibacteria group bacterium]